MGEEMATLGYEESNTTTDHTHIGCGEARQSKPCIGVLRTVSLGGVDM